MASRLKGEEDTIARAARREPGLRARIAKAQAGDILYTTEDQRDIQTHALRLSCAVETVQFLAIHPSSREVIELVRITIIKAAPEEIQQGKRKIKGWNKCSDKLPKVKGNRSSSIRLCMVGNNVKLARYSSSKGWLEAATEEIIYPDYWRTIPPIAGGYEDD